MKLKIEIRHWLTGAILFEYEKEGNTVKDTLEKAAKEGADLTGADLKGAYLKGAYLKGAYLTGADLTGADLKGAYLTGADLTGADLKGADLKGAYLKGAYLKGAYLTGADLTGAIEIPYIPLACPSDGAFVGWKKARAEGCVLVKLLIPRDARRSSATSMKCRCDKAKVLEISSLDGTKSYKLATSQYDQNFVYQVGKQVSVSDFDDNRYNECAPGIHFFINKQDAINY